MYRLPGRYRPARKNSRHSARAAANEAADRSREPVQAQWIQPLPTICWEASDQRRDMKRHSGVSGVSCVWTQHLILTASRKRMRKTITDLLEVTLVPEAASFPHLQGDSSACSIKVAYQAAEANHPGLGREGSPLRRIICRQRQTQSGSGEESNIGKGITPGDVDRSAPIHATGFCRCRHSKC